jgi:hypothetical protein
LPTNLPFSSTLVGLSQLFSSHPLIFLLDFAY